MGLTTSVFKTGSDSLFCYRIKLNPVIFLLPAMPYNIATALPIFSRFMNFWYQNGLVNLINARTYPGYATVYIVTVPSGDSGQQSFDQLACPTDSSFSRASGEGGVEGKGF